ncbi:hypothetical protein ACFE04_018142 [Oxalis oulophora]
MVVLKVIIVAVASTILAITIIFFFIRKLAARLHDVNKYHESSFHREEGIATLGMYGKRVKGLIVDENGHDVLYMRNSNGQLKTVFPKVTFNPTYEEQGKTKDAMITNPKASSLCEKTHAITQHSENDNENHKSTQPPSIPPPPPPPPPPVKKNVLTVPKLGSHVVSSSLRPPVAPRGIAIDKNKTTTQIGDASCQMKLKALYWDKVTANCDHSLVWNQVNDGSLRLDDGLIETLFGYTATNRKYSEKVNISSSSTVSKSNTTAQDFILDPRKSQNTAIVLRSIVISRREIVDALLEGEGLSIDILEKLTKIAPTQEEETKILQYKNDPGKLADAENFLYYILKASPSAFIRMKAMLFRSNYDLEILHLKESLQTLEIACKELRTRGIFIKLLEAILKAGNKMNAGTPRGNAQGFNLSTLRKISDVKSSDGKTTLLHFVVEQVIWSESKKATTCNPNLVTQTTEETNREYLKGLTTELSNVKKAASIEYDGIMNKCSYLKMSARDIQQLMIHCRDDEKGGFVSKMREFLEECEAELNIVEEEQKRVMQIVNRTRKYYQAGDNEDTPLELFVIVKDFLHMVDRAQVEILRKQDKTTVPAPGVWSSPPLSPSTGIQLRFHNFHTQFMLDVSRTTSSSESNKDF